MSGTEPPWPGHLLKQAEETAELWPEWSPTGSDLAGEQEDWLVLVLVVWLLLLLLVEGGGEEMGGVYGGKCW